MDVYKDLDKFVDRSAKNITDEIDKAFVNIITREYYKTNPLVFKLSYRTTSLQEFLKSSTRSKTG